MADRAVMLLRMAGVRGSCLCWVEGSVPARDRDSGIATAVSAVLSRAVEAAGEGALRRMKNLLARRALAATTVTAAVASWTRFWTLCRRW